MHIHIFLNNYNDHKVYYLYIYLKTIEKMQFGYFYEQNYAVIFMSVLVINIYD